MTLSALVVFHSADGHTATVAHRVANRIAEHGVRVTTERADHAPPPAGFDVVVLGDSIHLGHHSRELTRYATSHRESLAGLPVAVFQVSLTSAGTGEEATAEATRMLDDFCADTRLEPERVGLFAGALSYSRYRGMTRWLMRRVAADAGLEDSGGEDRVYTDWDEVEAFADAVVRIARRGAADSAAAADDTIAPLVEFAVPTVEPTATLEQVVDRLVAADSGVVLVRSSDADPLCTESRGGVVGVVSERDIIDALHDGADLSLVWAADIMSTRLVTLQESRSVAEVARAMADNHVRHVVVPGSGGRVGVVSIRSLVGRVAAGE